MSRRSDLCRGGFASGVSGGHRTEYRGNQAVEGGRPGRHPQEKRPATDGGGEESGTGVLTDRRAAASRPKSRRFPTCEVRKLAGAPGVMLALPIGNRRYSRLETCATAA